MRKFILNGLILFSSIPLRDRTNFTAVIGVKLYDLTLLIIVFLDIFHRQELFWWKFLEEICLKENFPDELQLQI